MKYALAVVAILVGGFGACGHVAPPAHAPRQAVTRPAAGARTAGSARLGTRNVPDVAPLAAFDFTRLTTASFTWDWPDGQGGDISYGGGALGVSEDGNFLYISCAQDHAGVAKLAIPGDFEQAAVVAPCQGPRRADLARIHPDPNAFRPMLGGVLEQDGRICVSAYISYDADGHAQFSHWCGPSLTELKGPFFGTVKPGMVGGPMAPIPPEWREALGGPALTSLYLRSIVSRSSYGFTASVFDPAKVSASPIEMTMLVGCPHEVPQCVTYGTPTSNDYNGSELSGGYFIVPGSRTLVAIEREASGPTCYGYATRDRAMHDRPYPSPESVVYCYSLSDPLNIKGPKGYPYRLVAKLYDLADLVDVREGRKAPWDVKQYATVDLPESSDDEFVTSGAYNPVRNEYYLLRNVGGGVNTVYIYRGFPQLVQP
jgi:hypothetical protein